MRTLKFAGIIVLALVLLLGLGPLSVAADFGASAGDAAFLDNQPHLIPAAASAWFRFLYNPGDSGTPAPMTLRLWYGHQSGVGFEVWEPDKVAQWEDNTPIGQGTPIQVPCEEGKCPSDDLTWSGTLGSGGIFYVRVHNPHPYAVEALVTAEGAGAVLPAQPVLLAAAPPLSATQPTLDDPAQALAIDGAEHTIAATAARWYRFEYAGTEEVTRPAVTLTLRDGHVSGVGFEVWAPEELNSWWENKPIGQGTPVNVMCVDGTSGCQSNDLTWSGAFGATGTYWVRVVNSNPYPTTVLLTMH